MPASDNLLGGVGGGGSSPSSRRASGEPGGARFDLVGLGEISVDDVLLVDEAPRWGGKARVRQRARLGGGQVATAMVAARRLGCTTALLGMVGDDDAGHAARGELAAEGVDVSGVVTVAGARTHAAVIVVDARAERTVLWSEATGGALTDADLPAARVGAGRILHVDGTFLDLAIRAADVARAHGARVSCDLDDAGGRAGELLARVDLCIVSSDFMRAFAGAGDPSTAVAALPRLAARLPSGGLAVVTLGAAGAVAWDGARFVEAAAFRGQPIVDTTACGDTFRAGFLCAFLDGDDVAGCLRAGNAAAALKMRDLGRRGCPTRAAWRALLDGGAEPPAPEGPAAP